ncbi:uncharacterized protein LOC131614000 [Vicia villosa]|uniref:uncharacterized protein LOC131614000 n=1 Tax=Vicia villosa TaxID=3911 RepID=UPI00273BC64B|nr:uncharacterized protein LOC131614000 [Vicia villosa]
MDSSESLQIKPRPLTLREYDLKLIIEKVVDFKSFAANGYPLREHFEAQDLMKFFDFLNGPTYPFPVKDFWVRAEVNDEHVALAEERNAVENDKNLKGKTRDEMSLKEFKDTKIRHSFMGFNITITILHN